MSKIIDIKSIRKAKMLTQKELADLCGVTTRTVQNWESGGAIPAISKKFLAQLNEQNTSSLISPTEKTKRLKNIYEYLRYKRIVRNLIDFAKLIDMNYTNLSSAMNGNEDYLTDNLFIKIQDATKGIINIEWLLNGEENMLSTCQSNPCPINDIAEQLKDFFNKKCLTQEDIANELGVTQQYVSALLSGKKKFGKKQAKRFSELWGISPSWLLTGEGSMLLYPNAYVANTQKREEDCNKIEWMQNQIEELLSQNSKLLNVIDKLTDR